MSQMYISTIPLLVHFYYTSNQYKHWYLKPYLSLVARRHFPHFLCVPSFLNISLLHHSEELEGNVTISVTVGDCHV